MLYAFVIAAILVALAEMGDKTQLLALTLATRFKAWQVLVGIFVATLAIHLLSTLAGEIIGRLLPAFWLAIGSGLLFIGFGIWTLRGEDDAEEDVPATPTYGPIAITAVAFFLAEIGDKTQIMTMTIAADPTAALRTLGVFGPAVGGFLASKGLVASQITPVQAFLGVWLGSTVGMMIADGLAIVIGVLLGKTLPEKLISRVAGVIFILFGVGAMISAFR